MLRRLLGTPWDPWTRGSDEGDIGQYSMYTCYGQGDDDYHQNCEDFYSEGKPGNKENIKME